MDKGTEMNLTSGSSNVEKVEKKTSLLEKKSNFRSQYSYGINEICQDLHLIFFIDERVKQFEKVTEAHPNKVPVILERAPSAEVPDIDKNKYLLPRDFTVANFLEVIRKRTNLSKEQALFVYVDGTVPASNAIFGSIYDQHKDKDGFLYVVYTGESSFGL
jgi:GABA(A) receptor-associated protein